jgi:hypothetical protein
MRLGMGMAWPGIASQRVRNACKRVSQWGRKEIPGGPSRA